MNTEPPTLEEMIKFLGDDLLQITRMVVFPLKHKFGFEVTHEGEYVIMVESFNDLNIAVKQAFNHKKP
jgi:hypothetical protein